MILNLNNVRQIRSPEGKTCRGLEPRNLGHASGLSQAGYTLIELMIGLLISLFMIAVTVGYMVSSSRSFSIQSNDAYSSENARFVMEYMAQHIRQAGRDSTNDLTITLDVVYNGDRCSAAAGASIVAGDTAPCTVDDFDNTESDRFAIDYVINNSSTGCNGTAINVPAGAKVRLADVFWTDDIDGDGIRSLYCQPLNLTSGAPVGVAAPIVDGVDRLQVQYGVDILAPGELEGDGVINSYQSYQNLISANPANPTSLTRQVRAIRLGLLLSAGVAQSVDANGVALDVGANTENFDDKSYRLLDRAPIVIAQDRVFRQVYSTTVLLPNNI